MKEIVLKGTPDKLIVLCEDLTASGLEHRFLSPEQLSVLVPDIDRDEALSVLNGFDGNREEK